ncbi:DUF2892 domain-containing protein [Halioglobus maricola]|uniref:DUF2892 domain-containing protein n=1 Tax=Halioglobus maricola TaxID=2601894 RepID=A0A5P9NF28_9GAMM|nr:DUF2892 domain-containing protein [Halioglobus maricola]QFU74360.1 DUF2892 domain-containing protein [Halioglobus maricola]
MIEKNIGNIERVMRLAFGLLLAGWILTRQDANGIDIFVGVVSLALILNGIFSRCYLWYVLDINTVASREDGRAASRDCKSV